MKLTIYYTDGFEKFRTEIGEGNVEYSEMDTIRSSIKKLEDQCNSLTKEITELKGLLSETSSKQNVDDSSSKQDGHISEYKHFDNYSLQRKYDKKKNRFFVSENRPKLNLGFIQLVAIIKAYQNGLPIRKMKANPILSKFSEYNLQHYIYIWRAGGFNQAIKDNARDFGYNPEKLLSKEMDE